MTLRVAIYARFSSDRQSVNSIQDQYDLCKTYADREGWKIVQFYNDQAQSGTSNSRLDYNKMLEASQYGKFDIVLSESLDRLSRDQEDIHHLYKRLNYEGVKLYTVADGEMGSLHVGLKGMIAAQYLEDLAQKTHRGLSGRVKKGKSAGGKSYGYKIKREFKEDGSVTTGELTIHPYEAEVVIRIFMEYADGRSAKAIAQTLNQERVPSPRGGKWNASTLFGNKKRGTGILNNRLYIGEMVWNRHKFRKNPETRKRISILNPEEEWIIKEVPDLRLIDLQLWRKVKARQKQNKARGGKKGKKGPYGKHPRHIISHHLYCPFCLGKYIKTQRNKWRCGHHIERGVCFNRKGLNQDDLEKPIYDAIKRVFNGSLILRIFEEKLKTRLEQSDHLKDWKTRQLQIRLKDVQKRKSNLLEALEMGDKNETLISRVSNLEEEEIDILSQTSFNLFTIKLEDMDTQALFMNALENLPNLIRNRPFGEQAHFAIHAALTNKDNWQDHRV